jgi:hypothetical protein
MKVTMSAPRLKSWLLLASLLFTISAARLVQAQASVGSIEVCYDCAKSFDDVGNFFDGPIFFIHNSSSSSSITNGVLKIGPGGGLTDSFNVGTILPLGTAQVAPGISNDQGTGHNFFAFVCSECIRDTSDPGFGPNGDDTQFEFTGRQGSKAVDSGVFTPAATRGPSVDGTVPDINFLGGPGNNDIPCGPQERGPQGCFDKTVATLSIPSTFSKTLTQPLSQTITTFNLNGTGPVLKLTVDMTPSGATFSSSDVTMRVKDFWITDSPSPSFGNQYDSLVVGTSFQGTKCLHQEITAGTFACVVTLVQCSVKGGPFSGANCPDAGPADKQFIEVRFEFLNDLSSINGPGLIEGTDNALTCTTPGGRPACENLRNVFTAIGSGSTVIIGHVKPGLHSIFVPFSIP